MPFVPLTAFLNCTYTNMKKLLLALQAILLLSVMKTNAQSSPSAISGLKLWLDASDINNGGANPADGSNITTWKDKSGNANNATQFSGQNAGKVYSNQINGKSVIRFARVSQTLGSVYQVSGVDIRATTMPAVTIFTVYKQGAQSGDQGLWGDDNGGWDRFYFTSWSSSVGADNGGASLGPQTVPAATVTGAGIVGVVRLMTAVYNRGVTNGSNIYFNGQTITTFTDNTDPTAAQTNLRIGWDGDDNAYNGDIAEMIVYNRKLDPCEIQQVNRYLNVKYGVSFSTVTVTADGPTSFSQPGAVKLTASSGTAYQWLKDGSPISGATNINYSATTSGDYSVAVTNTCIDTSAATTVTVTPALTDPGNALNFDGVDDYVDMGSSASLAPTAIKTMECWVRFNDLTDDQEIMSRSITGSGIEMLIYNNTLGFFCMNGTNGSNIGYPLTNFRTGVWYHIAASWDGLTKESMKLYVNGVSVGTRTDAGNINSVGIGAPVSTFKLGNWSTSATPRFFNGSIDEARVWSVQRSQSELLANMYNSLTAPVTNLIAYYKLDHGVNGGTNSNVKTAYDYSGNNLNGTLNGFALTGTTSNWVESYAMVVPLPNTATAINGDRFTASWSTPASGTVTNYILDVSTSPTFSSFVSGYNAKNVGTVNSYTVTGLALNTTYYYRVRANKTSVANQGDAPVYKSVTTLVALPVTWMSFTANAAKGNVQLEWVTAREVNNAYFSVERSTDGNNFSEIKKVEGQGNTTVTTTYNVTDNTPVSGDNYYRIKQVNNDGSYSYSVTKKVRIDQTQNGLVSVYPSPAENFVQLSVTDASLVNTNATIFDLEGQNRMHFTVTGGVQTLDIQTLQTGLYFVRLADGSVCKFYKQ